MYTRATIFFAFIAVISASPLSVDSVGEEVVEVNDKRDIKIIVISEHLDDDDEETLIPLDEPEDVKNQTVVEKSSIDNSTVEEESSEGITQQIVTNGTIAKNEVRTKRQTESLNLDDIETIVTVKNNRIGTEKKFYFKNTMKVVNDQRYSCKIGLKRDNIVFYHRCLWVGTTDTPTVIRDDTNVSNDLFDIAH